MGRAVGTGGYYGFFEERRGAHPEGEVDATIDECQYKKVSTDFKQCLGSESMLCVRTWDNKVE